MPNTDPITFWRWVALLAVAWLASGSNSAAQTNPRNNSGASGHQGFAPDELGPQRILPLPDRSLEEKANQEALLDRLSQLANLRSQLRQLEELAKGNPELLRSLQRPLSADQRKVVKEVFGSDTLAPPLPFPESKSAPDARTPYSPGERLFPENKVEQQKPLRSPSDESLPERAGATAQDEIRRELNRLAPEQLEQVLGGEPFGTASPFDPSDEQGTTDLQNRRDSDGSNSIDASQGVRRESRAGNSFPSDQRAQVPSAKAPIVPEHRDRFNRLQRGGTDVSDGAPQPQPSDGRLPLSHSANATPPNPDLVEKLQRDVRRGDLRNVFADILSAAKRESAERQARTMGNNSTGTQGQLPSQTGSENLASSRPPEDRNSAVPPTGQPDSEAWWRLGKSQQASRLPDAEQGGGTPTPTTPHAKAPSTKALVPRFMEGITESIGLGQPSGARMGDSGQLEPLPSRDNPILHSPVPGDTESTNGGWGKRLGQIAQDMYKAIATAPVTPSESLAPPADNEVASTPKLDLGRSLRSNFLIQFLLGLGVVTVIILLVLRGKKHSENQELLIPPASWSIETGKDVIQIFHRLAFEGSSKAERWWSHQRVTETLLKKFPRSDEPIQILTQTYERVRYSSESHVLSVQELIETRQAVEKIRGC